MLGISLLEPLARLYSGVSFRPHLIHPPMTALHCFCLEVDSAAVPRGHFRLGRVALLASRCATEPYLPGGVALAGFTIPRSKFFSLDSVQISSPMSQGFNLETYFTPQDFVYAL